MSHVSTALLAWCYVHCTAHILNSKHFISDQSTINILKIWNEYLGLLCSQRLRYSHVIAWDFLPFPAPVTNTISAGCYGACLISTKNQARNVFSLSSSCFPVLAHMVPNYTDRKDNRNSIQRILSREDQKIQISQNANKTNIPMKKKYKKRKTKNKRRWKKLKRVFEE